MSKLPLKDSSDYKDDFDALLWTVRNLRLTVEGMYRVLEDNVEGYERRDNICVETADKIIAKYEGYNTDE